MEYSPNYKLEEILESISDAFFSLDENLMVRYFNHASERLLDRKRDEVLGKQLFEAFPEAKGSIFEEKYSRALKEKQRIDFETFFDIPPYKNWYSVSVYPSETGISVFFQVITKQKQQEIALEKSNKELQKLNAELKVKNEEYLALNEEYAAQNEELLTNIDEIKELNKEIIDTKEFYQSIIESVQDGIWISDKQDIIFYTNDAMEKIAGISKENIIGNNVLTDFPDETTKDFNKSYLEAKKTLKPVWYDLYVKTPDGRETWQNGWLVPDIRTGFFNGMITTVRDITQRKITERQLNDSEDRFRKMFDHMNSGVAIYKPVDAGTDFKFVEFNKAAEKITRIKKKDVIGKTLKQKFPNMDKAPLFRALLNINETGEDIYLPPFYYKDDTREGWRENFIYKLPSGEIVAIFDDVTKRETYFRELKEAKEKAEESDKLKTTFLNNVSHEFRTPMNGILGFSGLMLKPNVNEARKKLYAEKIKESCEALLEVVTDTIEISQIQSNTSVFSDEICMLEEVFDKVIEQTKPKARKKGLEFITEFNCNLNELIIKTDCHKLYRLLKHLIDNAIKFTFDGYVKIVCDRNPDSLEISVIDSGIGISDEMQKVIFEPFRQIETGTTRKFGGNGIGLALVKGYIEMMKGEVNLVSKPGKGTQIKISVPIKKEKNIGVSHTDKDKSKVHWADKIFLIVDDEDINYMYLEEVLNATGAQTLYAPNGAEAIKIFESKPKIDLVLMDLKMPVMDGFEATKILKTKNPDLPVIAQTAYSTRKDSTKARSFGCDAFISKPINENEIIDLIKTFMKKI